jgi:hypothetical protein
VNSMRPEHRPGCALDPVHWLRHAITSAGMTVTNQKVDPHVDRLSAESLMDTLAHFAELPDWATVTLLDVARHATLMGKRFDAMCTCGATAQQPDRRNEPY